MLNELDPERKQYLIGFLQGDGSLSAQDRNRGKLKLEISDRDCEIVDWMISLDQGCNVRAFDRIRDTNFANDYSSVGFELCLRKIRDEFSEYIPYGRKSDKIIAPIDLPIEHRSHYLRGFLDADGSIGLTSLGIPFISFTTSSERLKVFIVSDVKERLGFDMRINRNTRDNIYNVTLFRENAVEYSKFLYDAATVYLERKYKKYLEVKQWIRIVPKRVGIMKRWLPYEDLIVISTQFNIDDKIRLLNRTKKSIETRLWRLSKSSNK